MLSREKHWAPRLQKSMNNHSSLFNNSSFLPRHTVWHTSVKPPSWYSKLIEKLKPRDQDWIRRLLIMSAFYHPYRSQTLSCKLNLVLAWTRNLCGSADFFSLLISQHPPVIPRLLWDMSHYGTISSYYKEKNQGRVCTLIQHLFKQMKSLWKFWRGNLFVPCDWHVIPNSMTSV